jgi:thiol-disulfide isomerase/thioredoxin
MNKRILYLIGIFLWLAAPAVAQTKAATGIPPFKILQTNGKFFSASELDKTKPVVLIYFAPDCPHCQVLMSGLFKNINSFKKTQLVLVTFKPVSELQLFEREFNTTSYPNIKTGTEGSTYFLRYYYNLSNTPFTAVFNKGTLVCSYRDINTPIDVIMNCVKNLK